MKQLSILIFLTILIYFKAHSQAYFSSKSSGNWNNPSSWNMVSGSSATNYPAAGDSVVIQNGDSIQVSANAQCLSLTVKGASTLSSDLVTNTLTVTNNVLISEVSSARINSGIITVTGNLSVNLSANLTQTGGVVSVVGLIFVISPIISAGSTLLNIDNGVFTCVGGVTITATTIPAGRFAEVKIGSASFNLAGALTTITTNAKITFTGTGTLTLAGIVTVSSASFTAGNGRVIYVGIPGTSQAIAALTYSRLAIAGIGSGLKTISGNVIVTDTLTLLTDTLQINSGSLTLNNNAAIVRTGGALISTPVFAGQVDVVYNNIQKDTTGFEMPGGTGILRNVVVNNATGIRLAKDIFVNGKLSLQNGELSTGNFVLTINNSLGGVSADPAVERANGYVSGKINRFIGTSTGIRIFPFGISAAQGYREYKIDYTVAPASAGLLSVQHLNGPASGQHGFPLVDGSVTLFNAAPYYWQADAMAGLSGGNYTLTLTGQGTAGVADLNTLRLVKRPSPGGAWTIDGIAGTNTGSLNTPVVVRTGMTNFSQFTIAGNSLNILPLKLLNFHGAASGNSVLLSWRTINERSFSYFSLEKSNDGRSFAEVAKLPGGSFSSSNHYQYSDSHIREKKNHYRLKMVDDDGKYSYSNIVLVTFKDAGSLLVSPTLARSFINITYLNLQKIELYNNRGQRVKKLTTGVNIIGNLPAGIYFIRAGDEVIRIVKE